VRERHREDVLAGEARAEPCRITQLVPRYILDPLVGLRQPRVDGRREGRLVDEDDLVVAGGLDGRAAEEAGRGIGAAGDALDAEKASCFASSEPCSSATSAIAI
jgi:hypothetical protein